MKVLILKTGRPYEDEAALVLRNSLAEFDPSLEVAEFDNTMASFNAVATGKVLVLSAFTSLNASCVALADYVDTDGVPIQGNLEVPMYQKRLRHLAPEIPEHRAISPVYISSDVVLIDCSAIDTVDESLDFETGIQYMATDFVELGYKEVFKKDVWLHAYREQWDIRSNFSKSTGAIVTVNYPRNIEPQAYLNDSLGQQIDMRPYVARARTVLSPDSPYLAVLNETLIKCDRCYLEMDIRSGIKL